MRFMGENAIGIAVSMRPGGDIIELGKNLDEDFARLKDSLPVGMELRKVSDQPAAVASSISDFVRSLIEAVVIVLIVSFFSLGKRAGAVVALSIPLSTRSWLSKGSAPAVSAVRNSAVAPEDRAVLTMPVERPRSSACCRIASRWSS